MPGAACELQMRAETVTGAIISQHSCIFPSYLGEQKSISGAVNAVRSTAGIPPQL